MDHSEAAYLISALIHKDLTVAQFYSLFEEDIHCLRFFTPVDATIINCLLNQGGLNDVPAFEEAIGESGKQRMGEINVEILDVPFKWANAVLWAATIQVQWQLEAGENALRQGLNSLLKLKQGQVEDRAANGETPGQVINRVVAKAIEITTLSAGNQIIDSYQATQGAREILYAELGLAKRRSIPTGFKRLDKNFAPLTRGELCILGGAEGSGKTALAQKWTHDMGVGVWFCELPEARMKARDALRLAKVGSLVDLREMGDRNLPEIIQTSDVKYRLDQVLEELQDHPVLYRSSYGATALDVFAAANYAMSRYGKLDYIVVDHIQLISPLAHVDQSFSVRRAYMELKEKIFSTFPDTALLVLQHLNGDIKRTYKGSGDIKKVMPQKSDLTYGGSGEADTAMILIRNPQYMLQMLGINAQEKLDEWYKDDRDKYFEFMQGGDLWVVKTRSGIGEGKNLPIYFNGGHYDFEEKGNDLRRPD